MNELLSAIVIVSCVFFSCCGDGTRVIERRRETVRSPYEHDVNPPYFRKPKPRPTVVPAPQPHATQPPIYQQQQQPNETWCRCGKIIRTCTWQNQDDEGCYIIFGEDIR